MVGALPTRYRPIRTFVAVVVLLGAGPGTALAQDTTNQIRESALLTPGRRARLGGLVVLSTLADHGVRSLVQDGRSAASNRVAGLGNRFGEPRLVFPVMGAVYLAGKVAGLDGVARTTVDAGKAIVLSGALVQVVKFGVGRARPFHLDKGAAEFAPFSPDDAFNSFPSGHTAVAFALATAIANRSSGKWGHRLLYVGAGLTGFARVNNDKHWLSDVVAGALVGHLAAKAVNGNRIQPAPVPGGVGVAVTF